MPEIRQNATLIPVGKKPGQNGKGKQQDRIIRLLIRYSYAGFTVVRLKGETPLFLAEAVRSCCSGQVSSSL